MTAHVVLKVIAGRIALQAMMSEGLRIYKSGYALVIAILFGFVGIFFTSPTLATLLVPSRYGHGLTSAMRVVAVIVSIPLLTIAICALFYYFFRRIKLSEGGIISKDWLGREQVAAKWDQVADLYLVPLSSQHRKFVVETANGTITFPHNFTNPDDFCDEVVRRAVKAKVTEWLPQGIRDFELPKTFSYKGWWDQLGRAFMGLFLAGILLLIPLCLLYGSAQGIISAKAAIAPLVMFIPFTALLILLAILAFANYRILRRHRKDEIIADMKSLTLRSPCRNIELSWCEISDYFIRGLVIWRAYVVRSPTVEIEFYPFSPDWRPLITLIAGRAINVPTKEWRRCGAKGRRSDLIDGEASKWAGSQRVYCYRTRSLRAICWLTGIVLLWCGCVLGLAGTGEEGVASATQLIVGISIGLGMSLTIWLAWRIIARVRILTDEHGITYEGRWRRIAAAWGNVTDFYDNKHWEGVCLMETAQGSFRFTSLIADYNQLKKEIKEKATQARSREWGKQ